MTGEPEKPMESDPRSDGLRLVELAALATRGALRIGLAGQPGPAEESELITAGLLEREEIGSPAGGYVQYMLRPTAEGVSQVNMQRTADGKETVEAEKERVQAAWRAALAERRKHLRSPERA